MSSGCNRTPEAIPDSPESTIQAFTQSLADNKPQVLWDALPPSYQTDVQEVITVFCDTIDPEYYDRAFGILGKAADVLKEKEEFIFNSPMALGTPLIESDMGNHWDEIVDLLETIVKSDISRIESLRQVDPGNLLASTGQGIMEDLKSLAIKGKMSSKNNPWTLLEQAQTHIINVSSNSASVEFSVSTNSTETVELKKVEGRWIPADMASQWKQGVSLVKEQMANLNGPEFEKAKPIINIAMSTIEGIANSLLKAQSQKEFDKALQSFKAVGDMLKMFQNSK
jgi:hypothetical protein